MKSDYRNKLNYIYVVCLFHLFGSVFIHWPTVTITIKEWIHIYCDNLGGNELRCQCSV